MADLAVAYAQGQTGHLSDHAKIARLFGQRFHVETYGAVGDGVTDDTTAIRAAHAAALAAAATYGSATVVFGPYTYLCSGALLTTDGARAQFVLPMIAEIVPKQTLRWEGTDPSQVSYIGLPAQTVKQTGGTIIKSTLTGLTYTAAGIPCVIGGPNEANGSTFSNLRFEIEAITVRLPDNPTLSGLDLSRIAQCEIPRLVVDVDATISGQSSPTKPWSVGVIFPKVNNNAHVHVGVLKTLGMFLGIQYSEHTHINFHTAFQCAVAAAPNYPFFHDAHIDHANWEICRRYNAIVDKTAATEAAAIKDNVAGDLTGCSFLSIDSLDIEHITSGDYALVNHISDASNSMYNAFANVIVIIASAGPSNGGLTRRGGTRVRANSPVLLAGTAPAYNGDVLVEDGVGSGTATKSLDHFRRTLTTTGNGAFSRDANGLYMSTVGTGISYLTADLQSLNYVLRAQLVTNNGAAFPGLVVRFTDASNLILVNKGSITERIAGVDTTIASGFGLADGDWIDVYVLGDILNVLKNGVSVGGPWVVTQKTSTKAGIYMQAEATSRIAGVKALALV